MLKRIVLIFTLTLGTHTPLPAHTDGSIGGTCASSKTRTLHDAIRQNNTSEMWYLLGHGSSAFERDFGTSAFDLAINWGNVKCLVALLRWAKFLGKDCGSFLYPALHNAAQINRAAINRPVAIECMRLLLEFEEEIPNKQITQLIHWWYLLHDVKRGGHEEKIALLQEFIARDAARAEAVQAHEDRHQQQQATAQAYIARQEAERAAAAARKKADEELLLSGSLKHRIAFFEKFSAPK